MLNVRHVTPHLLLIFWVIFCVLVAPRGALAGDPPAPPSPSPTTHSGRPDQILTPSIKSTNLSQLTDYLRRGDQARRAGRWQEAAHAYRAALELDPRPAIFGELGAAEEALGQHRDAADHLHVALAKRDELTADQEDRFAAAQRKALQRVGTLAISANPSEALVLIDGRPLGSSRLTYLAFVDPGSHTVAATLAGHADVKVSFEIAAGTSRPVPLYLPKLPAPGAPPPAALKAPPAPSAPPAGLPTLTRVGLGVASGTAMVSCGFLIVGGVLRDQVRNESQALGSSTCYGANSSRLECVELRDMNKAQDVVASIGAIGLTASLGLGVTAFTSIWWAPRREPAPQRPAAPSVRVQPAVGAGWGGVLMVGQW